MSYPVNDLVSEFIREMMKRYTVKKRGFGEFQNYFVIDNETGEDHGPYATLAQAEAVARLLN